MYGSLTLNSSITITPAGGGITVVGSTSSHTTSGSTNIALPSGCQAGDYCVIGTSRLNTCTITPPAGATDVMADFTYYSTTYIAHVYGYTLTSTDVTNGYISYSASSTPNWYSLVVIRGANATTPVDVAGTPASASPNNASSINCPINGVTTTAPNDLVIAFAFAEVGPSASVTFGTPTGWTAGVVPTSYNYQVATCHMTQVTAGATGSAVMSATTASSLIRGAGVQIAFKQ